MVICDLCFIQPGPWRFYDEQQMRPPQISRTAIFDPQATPAFEIEQILDEWYLVIREIHQID